MKIIISFEKKTDADIQTTEKEVPFDTVPRIGERLYISGEDMPFERREWIVYDVTYHYDGTQTIPHVSVFEGDAKDRLKMLRTHGWIQP